MVKASRDCRELEEKAMGVEQRGGPREMVSASRRLSLSPLHSHLPWSSAGVATGWLG